MKCPKCHRDTYSKKWGSCTACPPVTKAAEDVTESPGVIVTTTFNVTDAPANIVTGDEPVRRGRPRKYASNAERQAAYRGRKS